VSQDGREGREEKGNVSETRREEKVSGKGIYRTRRVGEGKQRTKYRQKGEAQNL